MKFLEKRDWGAVWKSLNVYFERSGEAGISVRLEVSALCFVWGCKKWLGLLVICLMKCRMKNFLVPTSDEQVLHIVPAAVGNVLCFSNLAWKCLLCAPALAFCFGHVITFFCFWPSRKSSTGKAQAALHFEGFDSAELCKTQSSLICFQGVALLPA